MTTVVINTSSASNIQNVLDVIVLAFSADPAARRMFPDPTQYLRYFPKFVKAFGGKAFRHGTAYHIDDFLGGGTGRVPRQAHAFELRREEARLRRCLRRVRLTDCLLRSPPD